MASGQFWVNNHAHIISGNHLALTRYLHYALQAIDVAPYLTGAVMPKLSQLNLNRIEVPTPPLAAQEAIAELLGAFDEKIELNRRMAKTLEETARVLFKSWFVNFDPVRAKVEGRATGLPDDVAALFPSSFADDGLPDGWSKSPLRQHLTITKGNSYKSGDLGASRTALVTLKSFARGGGYRRDGLKGFTGPYKPAQVVTPGDLVISATDVTQAAEVIGQPVIVEADGEFDTLVASLDTFIARPKAQAPWFWSLALREQGFVGVARGYTTGTTVLHLAGRVFDDFAFVLPKRPALLQATSALLAPLVARRSELAQETTTLAALRDTLLPKLISGELRFGTAEQCVVAVA